MNFSDKKDPGQDRIYEPLKIKKMANSNAYVITRNLHCNSGERSTQHLTLKT
jgi:hypothetical protein